MLKTQKLVESLKVLSGDSDCWLDKIVSDPTNSSLKNVPVFEKGCLTALKSMTRVDYNKVRRRISYDKNIIESVSFYNAQNTVGEFIKNINSSRMIDQNDKTLQMAKNEVSNFLTQYAHEKHEGHSGPFSRSVRSFKAHLLSELPFFVYVTPLYNVRGDFSEILISERTKIRTITDDEYLRIVDTHKPLKSIEYYQQHLRFVVEHRAGVKVKKPLDEAKSEYAFVTNLIRLICDGEPEFGQIYLLNSTELDVLDMRIAESRESTPQPPGFITLTPKYRQLLIKLYCDMKVKFNRGKKSQFLDNSIARYGMACRHSNYSNKIVDYVIALESLLIEGSGESTLKLAHRMSALCAKNDNERLYVWEFIKSVYKFRSGIVHKSSESPFTINSKTVSIDEVTRRLDILTSTAILRMNSIMTTVKTKDGILGFLDRSIYDKNLMRKIQKLWRNAPIVSQQDWQ